VRAAAERRRAEAEARSLLSAIWDPDAAPVTDPVSALQALAGKLVKAADVLGARLDVELVNLDGATAVAWRSVLRELRQTLVGMERLGLEERQLELAERYGDALAGVVRAILSSLFGALLEALDGHAGARSVVESMWSGAVAEIVPRELRRMAEIAEGPEVVRGELG
jgi:hypothetical protein